MSLKDWIKRNLSKMRGDWVSDIRVETSEGHFVSILNEICGNSYKNLNPKLKKLVLGSDVICSRYTGPYNGAFSHDVTVNMKVDSVLTYHCVEVKLSDGSIITSKSEIQKF